MNTTRSKSGGGAKRSEKVADLQPVAPVASVPAAARTMALFEVFAREKRELSKSELARLLDLPESSCSDLLNTLEELGYVSRTASTRRFYPTRRLISAVTEISQNDPFSAFGSEAAALLSQRSGETCTFGVLDEASIKIIAVYQGVHRLRYVVQPGDRVTMHATALGKALLGAHSEAEAGRLLRLKPLRRLTEATKTDPKLLEDELRKHRALGWYSAREEGSTNVSSLAIAGLVGGEPVGMSMIGPTERFEQNHDRYVEIMHEVKAAVFGGGEDMSQRKRKR